MGFGYIEASVFRSSLTHLRRALTAPAVARAARDAEVQGYAAVVPYGTLDLGLEITEMSAQPDRLRERFVEIGVPALDPLALALHLASLARSGVTNSRAAYPKASLD